DIWDGKEWVVIPTGYCYTLRVDESVLDDLHAQSRASKHRRPDSEGMNVTKMPLKEALLLDGKHGMEENFRYAHEYRTVQTLARRLGGKG
ncbi:MAG: hypothetical protein FWF01_03925, partial [Alphaproteobacteria bacterium]|nr:hypothetical protein [Alphaproteobacteria bacterium]